MKKIIFLLSVLLVSNGAFSQDVKFGIKAGANVSNISNFKMYDYGMPMNILEKDAASFGFHGGGFANISFGKYIGLQPELLFSMQGGKQRPGADALEGQSVSASIHVSNYRFYYVNLPVLLEIKPIESLGFLIGPQFGYNVYRSESYMGKTISGSKYYNEYETFLGKDPFNNFDVALDFGVQYTFKEHLNIGLRYNLGLTNSLSSDLFNYNGTWERVNSKAWKNRVFQISVGWLF